MHPLVLKGAAIGVEIDRLAVGEADPEPLLDVLVALVFLGESGAAPAFVRVGRGRVRDEGGLVVDEAGGLGQVDDGAFLLRVLVVGREFGVLEAEEAAAPVLFDYQKSVCGMMWRLLFWEEDGQIGRAHV